MRYIYKTKTLKTVLTLTVSVLIFSSTSLLLAKDLPVAANILANSGFEEGVKSWGMSSLSDKNSGICDSVFHQGNYSALIKCKGEGKLQHISQALPLPPAGSMVECSVWVKTSNPEVEYQIYCDITAKKEGVGEKTEHFAGYSTDIRKNPDSEWKEVKLSFTFPAEQTDKDGSIKKMCGFYFRLATKNKIAGDIWFDDVSVIVTPPSSK